MANNVFDREILNLRERPLSTDLNTGFTELDQSVRAALQALSLHRTTLAQDLVALPMVAALSAGFHGNGFRVRAVNPLVGPPAVIIEPGLGWFNDNFPISGINGIGGLDDPNTHKPLVNPTALTYNLAGPSAPPPGPDPRVDIIEVKIARAAGDPTARDILNPGTGIFAPATVNKTLSYVNGPITTNGTGGINYKVGVATPGAAYPANAPAVSAGYIAIGYVVVPPAAATIPQNVIGDLRKLLLPGGTGMVHGSSAGATLGSVRGAAGVSVTMTRAALVDSYFIFAGDASLTFHAVFHQSGGATFNNTRITAITGGAINLAQQVALAAAVPPLAVAIGQPFIQIDLTHETTAQNQVYAILLANS